ncbi:MAG TPA: alpha/beta hydrolase [Xanthobacteraceae bacterium]|nr:alpha/beta hydrolase [Xanthobacteraceae bacterium]
MPIIKAGPYDVDYAEAGHDSAVLLLHSSAAGNRQWRKLVEERSGKNRMIAANLFGYGKTSAWPGERPMTLDDQANLVLALAHFLPERFTLVGHSLGAAVALQAATRLQARLNALVLYEPIPFYLLRRHNETEAFAEIDEVRSDVVAAAKRGDWESAARRFIDYWGGHGAWDATNDERRAPIISMLPANIPEWEMMFGDGPALETFKVIDAPVHVIYAANTRLSTRTLVELLRHEYPRWHFHEIESGGHTAPISRPGLVNPVIAGVLDGSA